MRVLLVSMPFGLLDTPAPGLGLLHAALVRDGVECRQRYLALDFAVRIGIADYLGAGSYGMSGEWLFSGALFGDEAPEAEGYLRELVASGKTPEPVAARLRRLRGEAERFIDDCMKAEEWERYDLVGFSSSSFQNVAALALARRLKESWPGLRIACGGANFEAGMGAELMRRFLFVDLAFSGESDESFPEAVRRLRDGESLEGIPGLTWREEGQLRFPDRWVEPVRKLDRLPFPNYDDYFRELKQGPLAPAIDPVVPVETSRGCWWGERHQCHFCGLNGSSLAYRSKSAERVLEELRHLAARHGKRIAATDNVLDMGYFDDLLPRLVGEGRELSLFWETKASLSREQVAALRASGVRSIQPGIESLSTPILKLMGKGCTALQNVQLLKWCFEYGVWPCWSILVGFPGEEPAEYARMAKWVPLLAHLPPPTTMMEVRLDRFSPYFEEPEKHGLRNVRPLRTYRHVYPFPDSSLKELAYFFEYDHADGRNVWTYVDPLLRVVGAEWRPGLQLGALSMTEDGDSLRIRDARAATRRTHTELRGAEREIYLLCDTARGPADLARALAVDYPEWSLEDGKLGSFLGRMVEDGLMLEDGGRYLSLAVTSREPLRKPRPDRVFSYPL